MPSARAQPKIQLLSPSIGAADEAAANGNWTQAIAIWERLLDTPDRLAATRRIRWFLETSTESGTSSRIEVKRRSTRKWMLLASLACAFIGTACVFLGHETSGKVRLSLAVIAWVLYIATAIMVVAYAYASGSSPSTVTASLSTAELHRVRQLAAAHPETDGYELPRD